MSLEDDLYAALLTQCPRVFPDVAEPSTQRPYVTYQQIGGDPSFYVEGQAMARVNAFVQINVFHVNRPQANALSRQIEAALLQAVAFQAEPMSALIASHDDDTLLCGAQQDFSIWAQR